MFIGENFPQCVHFHEKQLKGLYNSQYDIYHRSSYFIINISRKWKKDLGGICSYRNLKPVFRIIYGGKTTLNVWYFLEVFIYWLLYSFADTCHIPS